MTRSQFSVSLLALLAGATLASAAPTHELYISASVNKGYVIGSKIVTTNGLFRRPPGGDWQHFGYNDTSIRAFSVDPRDRRVIFTAANNGCWRTLDGGEHWRLTTSWDMTEPLDVMIDPNAPDHVYLALPDGIAVSTDRGQTFPRREAGLPERGKYTQVVKVDRTKAGRVLAGCESGIYLTTDGAKSWKRMLPTDTTVDDLQQSPHDPKVWVAVTQSNGAWISRDGGLKWKKFTGVPSDHALYNVVIDPRDPQRIAIGSYVYGVHVTVDGGATWAVRNQGLPASPRVWRIGVDPDTSRLYASVVAEALYVSDDFGQNWKKEGLEDSVVSSFQFLPAAQ